MVSAFMGPTFPPSFIGVSWTIKNFVRLQYTIWFDACIHCETGTAIKGINTSTPHIATISNIFKVPRTFTHAILIFTTIMWAEDRHYFTTSHMIPQLREVRWLAQGDTVEVAELALKSLLGAIMCLFLPFDSLIFWFLWILSLYWPLLSDHIHLCVSVFNQSLQNTAAGLRTREVQEHHTFFSLRYTFQPLISCIGEPTIWQKWLTGNKLVLRLRS